MSFKAIGSLAVRVNARDTVRVAEERGLGVDVEGAEVLLGIPSAEIAMRLDVGNARRLRDFLSHSLEVILACGQEYAYGGFGGKNRTTTCTRPKGHPSDGKNDGHSGEEKT